MPIRRLESVVEQRAIIDRRAIADRLAEASTCDALPILKQAMEQGRGEIARRLKAEPHRGRAAPG